MPIMEILKKGYSRVLSLQEYLQAILPDENINQLLQHPKKGFPLFLTKTVVAMEKWKPPDRTALSPIVLSEEDDQMELVEEVIRELLSSGRTTDVLTCGLHRKSGNAPISFHPDHNYPQLITPYWSNLLQIIGQKNMKELLLNAALFTAVSPSNYIQISGIPIQTIIATKSASLSKPPLPGNNRPGRSKDKRKSPISQIGAITAVSLCYDRTWHRKLNKKHPLNLLPASNRGALELLKLIFPKQRIRDGSRKSKRKIDRVPRRLVQSKNLLRQLLVNFKKTALRVYHPRLKENPAIQRLFETGGSRASTKTSAHENNCQGGSARIIPALLQDEESGPGRELAIGGIGCETNETLVLSEQDAGATSDGDKSVLYKDEANDNQGDLVKGYSLMDRLRNGNVSQNISSKQTNKVPARNESLPGKSKEDVSSLNHCRTVCDGKTKNNHEHDNTNKQTEEPIGISIPLGKSDQVNMRSIHQDCCGTQIKVPVEMSDSLRKSGDVELSLLDNTFGVNKDVVKGTAELMTTPVCGRSVAERLDSSVSSGRDRSFELFSSPEWDGETVDPSLLEEEVGSLTEVTTPQRKLSAGSDHGPEDRHIEETSKQGGTSDGERLVQRDGETADPSLLEGEERCPSGVTSHQRKVLTARSDQGLEDRHIEETSKQGGTSDGERLVQRDGEAVDPSLLEGEKGCPRDVTSHQRNLSARSGQDAEASHKEEITKHGGTFDGERLVQWDRETADRRLREGEEGCPRGVTSHHRKLSARSSQGAEDRRKEETSKHDGAFDGESHLQWTISQPNQRREDIKTGCTVSKGACDSASEQGTATESTKLKELKLAYRRRILQQICKKRVARQITLRQRQPQNIDSRGKDLVHHFWKKNLCGTRTGMGCKRKLLASSHCADNRPAKKARLEVATGQTHNECGFERANPENKTDLDSSKMDLQINESNPCEKEMPNTSPCEIKLMQCNSNQTVGKSKTELNSCKTSSKHISNPTFTPREIPDGYPQMPPRSKQHSGQSVQNIPQASRDELQISTAKLPEAINIIKHNWRRKSSLNDGLDPESPISMGLTGIEVYVPLRALLKKIIPDETLGLTANQRAFFKYVKELLKLGRFEKLPLSLLTTPLKTVNCKWSSLTNEDFGQLPRTDRIKKHELVVALFIWLVTELVVPLIRSLYYVTETSASKNELIYYPKHIWKKLQEKAISDYVNLGIVRPVEQEYVNHLVMTQKTLGKSKLRFIPKETGFRPIVKMGKSTLPNKTKFGINLLLSDVLDVLKYLKKSHPELFGASLLGITSIYPKWKEFVHRRQEKKDTRPLYFVKVDISKCYDSIPHNKLPVVMATILKEKSLPQSYLLRRYTLTSTVGTGEVNRQSLRHVTPVYPGKDHGKSFHQTLVDLANDGSYFNGILCNQASSHLETVDSLLSRLHHLVKYDIISIDNKDFLRTKGISQGSVLSSLLCSIFYSSLENGYLVGIAEDGLLMRLIDDFLLVTPHLDSATRFLDFLFSDECTKQFGCEINPLKTLTNFDFKYSDKQLHRVKDEDWFPWCGFLFNMKTLEVQNDYQRYEGTSFRYSMTLSFESVDTLEIMKRKLIQALHRSKGLLIFIDPSINSLRVIIKNVYYLLLVTAFRFHSYIQALPHQLKKNLKIEQLLDIILVIGTSFYFKARACIKRLSAGQRFPLDMKAIKWLCVKAFDVKLSRHLGAHKMLVVKLRHVRKLLSRRLNNGTRFIVAEASTPDIPASFYKTRF